jgi:hypothetical protein
MVKKSKDTENTDRLNEFVCARFENLMIPLSSNDVKQKICC